MLHKFIKAIFIILIPIYVFADEATPIKSKDEVLRVKKEDFVLGDKKAKVVFVEYSSLACPHCATYHKRIFPEIKKNYINTGKIRYVFRDFPTNHPATLASLLIHCSGDRKLNFMEMLFETQKVWAYNVDYKEKLRNIAKLGGIPDAEYTACTQDNDKINYMLGEAYEAVKSLEIGATPVFFINGEKLEGNLPYKKFADTIDNQLAKKKS